MHKKNMLWLTIHFFMVPEHISFSSPVIYSKRTISFFSLFMIFFSSLDM